MTILRLRSIATALDDAWCNARAIPAPSLALPSLTVDEAYAIQEMLIELRSAGGKRVAGWKMGLTSANPPTTPITGILLEDMVLDTGADLLLHSMVAPMVEAELVVRIGERIDRPMTVDELERGPHEVGPGIEVIDYRTTDSSGIVDWIADNSTVAYAVVGTMSPLSAVSRKEVEVSLSCDGRNLATGTGAMVMGDPLAAVAWLSGHVAERGRSLEQGDVILTGSLTGHHRVTGGDRVSFDADFGGLGQVRVRFNS